MRSARLVVPLVALAVTLAACTKTTEGDPDLLGDLRVFVSPDAASVFVVDLAAFADTPPVQKFESVLREAHGIGVVIEQLDKPLGDVAKRAVFAMADVDGEGLQGHTVHAVLETTLDDGFLGSVMANADQDDFDTEVVDRVTMWVQTGGDAAFAQYPGGYLGFGHADAVRAMTRRVVSESGGLAADAAPLQLARELAEGAIAWGVVRAHPRMIAELPAAAGDLSALEHVVLAVTRDEAGDTIVDARAITDSPQGAQDMEGRIQLVAGMGALSDDMDPDLADVLASLSVRREGTTISLRAVLPSEVITSLFGDDGGLFHSD